MIVTLTCVVFLGFYQCGGYISVWQTVTALAGASFVLFLASIYQTSGNSPKIGVGLTAVFIVLLIMAWYSGQALYMTPSSVYVFSTPVARKPQKVAVERQPKRPSLIHTLS